MYLGGTYDRKRTIHAHPTSITANRPGITIVAPTATSLTPASIVRFPLFGTAQCECTNLSTSAIPPPGSEPARSQGGNATFFPGRQKSEQSENSNNIWQASAGRLHPSTVPPRKGPRPWGGSVFGGCSAFDPLRSLIPAVFGFAVNVTVGPVEVPATIHRAGKHSRGRRLWSTPPTFAA